MIRLAFDLALAFVGMGVVETVVKPIAKQWTQRRILAAAPVVLELLDSRLPQFIREMDGDQLNVVVRSALETYTGESWDQRDVDAVFELYDPRITASHQSLVAKQDPAQ